MLPTLSRVAIIPLVSLLLTACVADKVKEEKQRMRLEDVLSHYETTVRWSGEVDKAYSFVKPEALMTAQIPRGLEKVRVTAYDVVQPPIKTQDGTVIQSVRIKYYLADGWREKTLVDDQLWEFDEESGRWWRANIPPAMN